MKIKLSFGRANGGCASKAVQCGEKPALAVQCGEKPALDNNFKLIKEGIL